MEITNLMSAGETARTRMQVDTFNKSFGDLDVSGNLGKDDFLNINRFT